MKPGDSVDIQSNATTNGTRVSIGRGIILEKVGDVPHFYRVRLTCDMTTFCAFVYPDQLTKSKQRRDHLKVVK